MPDKNPQNSLKPLSPTANQPAVKAKPLGPPSDVAAIRKEINTFFKTLDENGRRLGSHKWGIYAFYDYDGEPIYVGQTFEGVSSRISRHLTNQRTDAVAMNVLDPFEVAEIRVWPIDLSHLADPGQEEIEPASDPEAKTKWPKINERQKEHLNSAEYTVFQKVLSESKLHAVLNEKPPDPTQLIDLPKCYAKRIIPDDIYPHRKHPDARIARRASTIASLARVISERSVQRGLRATLLTQAKRLEHLAEERLKDFPEDNDDQNEG
jgi:hypothetical protein